MRIAVRVLLAVVLLGTIVAMTWAGGLYYWHFKVERIVRYMDEMGPEAVLSADMENTLHRAGCRALPNLIRATLPKGRPTFLAFTTHYALNAINQEPARSTQDCDLRSLRRAEMEVRPDDGPAVAADKVARLQAWWTEHGAGVHQWWRFWSANCRYPEL